MGFILDGFEAEEYDRQYNDRELLQRILSYFRPQRSRMLLVATMVLLASIAETVIPIAVSAGIDLLAGRPELQLALAIAGGAAVLGSLSWFFNFVRQSFSAQAVGAVVLQIREDAMASVMQRDLSFYDQYASGKIVSRVTSDTQDFATVVTLTIDLMSQVLFVVIISIVLLFINWQLTLIALAVAPLVFAGALAFRRLARVTTQQAQRAVAQVNATVQESISGIAVAKSFRQEGAIYDDFRATNALAYRVRLQQGLTFNSIFPILDILSGVGLAAVIYFGGSLALSGSVSTGEWYLFIQAIAIFFFPLTSIASFWSQFQQGLSAAERVFALIDAEARVNQTANHALDKLKGDLRFEQIWFSYQSTASHDNDDWVLRDFNLHIQPGEKLALVGHTGAGKSSIAKLVTRFYEFQRGQLLVDEHDIRTLDLGVYRRQIGLVPQVPFLFSGSVADNIRYGRPEASDADVAAVAAQLSAEWVNDLPNGLATDVGERGARLSLGQRQLVALARVLLQNPAILILDEATASIDPFTETQIQDGLDVVMKNRTSIIIAHRLSTVRNADRIIVLKRGEIIEQGNHRALMAQGGHYAELYNTYFRHQSLEYIEQVGQL
jgi:ABC-type multidrug transport system fused ATPase/permease subunit